MRPAICLVPVIAAAAVLVAGCGYAGEPKPPALRRPMKVTELTAVERGARIVVTFTLPQETTEGLPIEEPPDIELRIGVLTAPWNQDAWAANSERVPVPAWQIARAASGGGARRVLKAPARAPAPQGALSASGRAAAKQAKTARAAAKKSASAAQRPVFQVRTIEIEASKYVDKATAIGVKVHGPRGRDDGWAMVSLDVMPVLEAPRDLHAVDAPNAVHLEWRSDAPAFRVFRRVQDEKADGEWIRMGDSAKPMFDDPVIEYGKTWQYYVLALRQVGEHSLESDPSAIFTFKPADHFPPAVPTGLVAIPGSRTVELAWDPVTDADLGAYRVYRNGVRVGDALMKAAYSDKEVVAGAKYSYQVSAVDQAGNESEKSAAQEVTME